MQSFLAKCAALGIVAGGFTLTGDVARLAERGSRLLDARTVPSEANDQSVEEPREPQVAVAPAATPMAAAAATEPAPRPTPVATPDAAAQRTESFPFSGGPEAARRRASPGAVPPPPANGPESVDPRHLPAGRRLLVWVRRSGPGFWGPPVDLVALDMIDPAGAEALEQRHAVLETDGDARATLAPPRRVVISAPARIAKGANLRLAPRQARGELGPTESLGTVVAIEVQGR
jgi:hypothetical protein